MSNLEIPDYPLPTPERLGVAPTSLSSVDVPAIAQEWFTAFSTAALAGDAEGVAALFLPTSDSPDGEGTLTAHWRDMLALTWDFRTFTGVDKITTFLKDRLALCKLHDISLRPGFAQLERPFPDTAWISLVIDFSTEVARASGIVRLVPVPHENGIKWKTHVVYTNIESLLNFPEKSGHLRNKQPNHGKWENERQREKEFLDADPTVLVIGGGQSGLEIAARLKFLDISALVIERNSRIGDNWRNRYEALCLHDPVWYDHMPYIPFPATWPVYTPALKLANWLEFYADSLELNVWTSSNITSIAQDPATSKWNVAIKRGDGSERKFTVKHVVFAVGIGGGKPNTPKIPGMETFKGQTLHSTEHDKATDHAGKKVVIVGACTSAHDIAVDYYQHGIDVTMFQRGVTYVMSTKNGWDVLFKDAYEEGAPPVDIVDRFNSSFPHFMGVEYNARKVRQVAELDKELLDGLKKVGFKTNLGIKDSGFPLLAWSKVGGYYLDTGASGLIADGKIKVKSGTEITHFTPSGLAFADGTTLDADVVLFATGVGNAVEHFRRILGEDVVARMNKLGGLNKEGEIRVAWRGTGVPGLWYMFGNLALCRFHSTHVTLQIKAIEEGVFGTRYEAEDTK